MTCPHCAAKVPAGAPICEGCLHVVDASLLESPAAAREEQAESPVAQLLEAARPSQGVLEAIDELQVQWRALPGPERWTLRAAGATLVVLGLPWSWSAEAFDVIGYFAGGWPVGLLALLVGLSVLARGEPRIEAHRARIAGAAAGLASFAVLTTAVFLRTARHAELLRSGGRLQLRVLEAPAFGAWLGLATTVVMLIGALGVWRGARRR